MNDSKKVIFLRWEKLRIGYNLILLVEGVWLLREYLAAAFTRFRLIMVLFAIAANVCYFLGPMLEICVRTLLGSRADRPRYQSFLVGLRYFLFSVGLLFSMWWALMWAHRGLDHLHDARYSLRSVQKCIRTLSKGVDAFHSDVGRYPTTTEGSQALIECPKDVSQEVWHGPYLKPIPFGSPENPQPRLDPWHQEYHYTYTPQRPRGLDYEIVSAGEDGKLGTDDDITNYHEPPR